MPRERRNFARLAMHAKASVHLDGQTIEGEVENLSMKGVFVAAAPRVEMNETVAVTIYHTLTPQALCNLKARVVRITDRGMGLQFEKTLLD